MPKTIGALVACSVTSLFRIYLKLGSYHSKSSWVIQMKDGQVISFLKWKLLLIYSLYLITCLAHITICSSYAAYLPTILLLP